MDPFLKIDASALAALVRELGQAKAALPAAQATVVNRVAGRAQPVIVRTLTGQTGLSKRTIAKAVRLTPAMPGRPVALLTTKGGDISLKYFQPREGGGGVTATVKGKHVTIAGGFVTAGPKGHRVAIRKLGGHVWVNAAGGKWGGRITKVRSGVLIPTEMTSGATLAAFDRITESALPAEAMKALVALLPGK